MDTYLQHLNTEAGIPVIYLDYYNGREASDSVISNSYYGTYELTYYLYRMGHRKIAYVGTLLATRVSRIVISVTRKHCWNWGWNKRENGCWMTVILRPARSIP